MFSAGVTKKHDAIRHTFAYIETGKKQYVIEQMGLKAMTPFLIIITSDWCTRGLGFTPSSS